MSEHCKDGEHKWWQDSPDDLVYCEKCRIYNLAYEIKRYKQALEDIIAKRKSYNQGSVITNCVEHIHKPILERPDSCYLCQTDISNTLSRAFSANEFLNNLFDEIEEEQDDAP